MADANPQRFTYWLLVLVAALDGTIGAVLLCAGLGSSDAAGTAAWLGINAGTLEALPLSTRVAVSHEQALLVLGFCKLLGSLAFVASRGMSAAARNNAIFAVVVVKLLSIAMYFRCRPQGAGKAAAVLLPRRHCTCSRS